MKTQKLTRGESQGIGTNRWAGASVLMILLIAVSLAGFIGCTQAPQSTSTNAPQAPTSPPQQSAVTNARFEQIDLRINADTPAAVVADDSGWGWLHLGYRGSADVQYLNLTAGEQWAVRNLPLVSVLGSGAEQKISVAFGLGVAPGTRVTELKYGLSVTNKVVEVAPRATETARVEDGQVIFSDGQRGDERPTDPKGPQAPVAGGPVTDDKPHTNDANFPNQESRPNFCVPVAVSNSLQWLKATHRIPDDQLPDGDTSVDGWSGRFGTGPDGTDLGPDGKPNWPKKKADYKKPNFPIETTEVAPGDVAKIADALDRDCDVELNAAIHVAAIVGIVRTQDGKYTITVRHDTKQGKAGGTVDEAVTFDPATGKISGGTFLDGRSIFGFVVECYKKP